MRVTNKEDKRLKGVFETLNILRVIVIFIGVTALIIGAISLFAKHPIYIGGEAINLDDDGKLMSDASIYEKVFILGFIAILFVILPLSRLLGQYIGSARAKHKTLKNEKYIKKINPYIYYRDLPNSYGIGVCTLLIDSSIENEKDIVAAILDLCAKKYLKLEKSNEGYVIHVLKKVDDKSYLTEDDIFNKLLLNEKYILQCINNNTLKHLDYNRWYSLCLRDGKNLDLYFDKTAEKIKRKFNSKLFKTLLITIMVTLSVLMVSVIGFEIYKSKEFSLLVSAIIAIASLPVVLIGCYFISLFLTGTILMVRSVFTGFAAYEQYFYNSKLGINLTLTENGMIELQKLYAFERFIKDFSAFAQKNVDEIVLWDRYLSYAQVFGLTEEIVKSGYQQLVDNSSFKIDAIDNIKIDNIEIL